MQLLPPNRIALLAAALLGVLLLPTPPAEAACTDSPKPGVDWSRCDKAKKRLAGAELSGGQFIDTDFSGSSLNGAELRGARMLRTNLLRATLNDADLSGADLSNALGSRARLIGANLTGAIMNKAEFSRADLSGANLSEADLSKADFPRAKLTGSNLSNAVLVYANVSRAQLQDATLAGADFHGAYTLLTRFEGSDLSAALNLTQEQLEIACGDDETTLPPDLIRPASWPCGGGNTE